MENKKATSSYANLLQNKNVEGNENDDFENFKITKTSFVRLVNATPKENDPFADLSFDAEQMSAMLKSKRDQLFSQLPFVFFFIYLNNSSFFLI